MQPATSDNYCYCNCDLDRYRFFEVDFRPYSLLRCLIVMFCVILCKAMAGRLCEINKRRRKKQLNRSCRTEPWTKEQSSTDVGRFIYGDFWGNPREKSESYALFIISCFTGQLTKMINLILKFLCENNCNDEVSPVSSAKFQIKNIQRFRKLNNNDYSSKEGESQKICEQCGNFLNLWILKKKNTLKHWKKGK